MDSPAGENAKAGKSFMQLLLRGHQMTAGCF